MPIGQELGGYPDTSMKLPELVDHVANMQKTVEFYLGGNLDSDNAREFGGWQIKKDKLVAKTGDVGLSSGPGTLGVADPTDPVRIWAGDKMPEFAPFRVYQSGKTVMTNAEISGTIHMTNGNIIWGNVPPPDYAQIAGNKPPADANNTYNELLFNSGIRGFTNVNGTLFLTADYIRGGTVVADILYGGTIRGVTINVDTNLTVGNNIYVGNQTVGTTKQILLNGQSVISATNNVTTISTDVLEIDATTAITFSSPVINGLPGTSIAVFG